MVTGGAGFIGSALVGTLLARGDEVTVVDDGSACGFGYLDHSEARLVRTSISDAATLRAALDGVDAVIHLAARTNVPGSVSEPLADFETNVGGSLTLLDATRDAGVERFVFASSNAAVAGNAAPMHETLLPRPVAPYGAAKAAIEAYLAAYHSAYSMTTVALRFANAYGPRSAHKSSVVASFARAYLEGRPLPVNGSGEQTRDFVFVDDVCAAVVACLEAPAATIAGEIFQVGSGAETSVLALAAALEKAGGRPARIEHRPAAAADVARNVSDIRKARRVLGYAPRVALDEGLRRTLEWFDVQRH